ncbi:MAG: oxidoreductase, partial [Deltaproteobacteria bacterium]|nr:oxidoreductase [Deltaproteobacteria bacterium]
GGVSLLGVDSAHCPNDLRQTAWTRLAGGNKPRHLSNIARTIHLEGLPGVFSMMLNRAAEHIPGRMVVELPHF